MGSDNGLENDEAALKANGISRSICLGIDGQGGENGQQTHWAQNGRIVDRWIYKDGKPIDGKRTSYYDDGSKKKEVTYRSGLENGPHIEWGPDGRVLDQWEYVNGIPKDGRRIVFYPNGTKEHEFNYKDGRQNGKEFAWFPDGHLSLEDTFVNGRRLGVHRVWDKNGHLESDELYAKKGPDKYLTNVLYYKNNARRELDRLKNQQEITHQIWYRNGFLKLKESEEGTDSGEVKLTFYPDGSKRSEEILEGDKIISRKKWGNGKFLFSDFQERPDNED